jgi:uncharacterized integral membrane protein
MASIRRKWDRQDPVAGDPGAARQGEEGIAPSAPDAQPTVPSTRTGRAWLSLSALIVVLIVVLVFILQNLTSVRVSFFVVHWKIPLALDLLLAAILGGGVVLTAGSLRILQLRRLAKRRHREALRRPR